MLEQDDVTVCPQLSREQLERSFRFHFGEQYGYWSPDSPYFRVLVMCKYLHGREACVILPVINSALFSG